MRARCSILPVFIPHIGCPHACVFCNQHEITGAAAESAIHRLEEICRLQPSEEKRELAFYGGSFTAIPMVQQLQYLNYAKKALDAGIISSIRLSTRPDALNDEILRCLNDFGVQTVEIGAQSMQNSVLQASGRGHMAEDVRRASHLVREAGFTLVLQMMTGLPEDSDDGAVDTARQLIELTPDAVRIYPTVVVRGTALEQLWREGKYPEHTVEDAIRICARIVPQFEEVGIPVIRIGLNPTEELSGGAALAGAYHPALGELVRSRVLRNRAEVLLAAADCSGREVIISVPPKQISQMIGQKQCNAEWLREHFHLKSLVIKTTGKEDEMQIQFR